MNPDTAGPAILFVIGVPLTLVFVALLAYAKVPLEPETAYRARRVKEAMKEYVEECTPRPCDYCRTRVISESCTNCGAPG